MKTAAVILSGGIGSRVGAGRPKQYIEFAGEPILLHSLRAFEDSPETDGLILVLEKDWEEYVKEKIRKAGLQKPVTFAPAGKNRQRSVLSGLLEAERLGAERVIVHDGVRPFVTADMIRKGLLKLRKYQAVITVIPIPDTPYLSDNGESVTGLLHRPHVMAGQTPEYFDLKAYLDLHRRADPGDIDAATGSSSLAFQYGMQVGTVEGSPGNFKITTPEDLVRYRTVLRETGDSDV